VIDNIVLTVDSSSKCSSETFVSGTVEPNNGVNSTCNQSLAWLWLLGRFNKHESFFLLNISLAWFKIFNNLIARECLLQKHSLTKVSWEINQNPPVLINRLDLSKFILVLAHFFLDNLKGSLLLSLDGAIRILHLSKFFKEVSNDSCELEFSFGSDFCLTVEC